MKRQAHHVAWRAGLQQKSFAKRGDLLRGGRMGGGPEGAVLLEPFLDGFGEADVAAQRLGTKEFVAEDFVPLKNEETPEFAVRHFPRGLRRGAGGRKVSLLAVVVFERGDGGGLRPPFLGKTCVSAPSVFLLLDCRASPLPSFASCKTPSRLFRVTPPELENSC